MDIVSKGGNLLLNVGPDGNGVVQQEAIDNMLQSVLGENQLSKVNVTSGKVTLTAILADENGNQLADAVYTIEC